MHRLTICTLGPDDPQLLTRAAYAALTGAAPLLLRTERHGVADFLRAQGKEFETLDALYAQCEDFDELCDAAQARIRDFARQYPEAVYGVSDPASDETVRALCRTLPADICLQVLPGVSLTDAALGAAIAQGAPAQDAKTVSVLSLAQAQLDPLCPLVVTEIDTRVLAGDAKLALMRVYPDEQDVYFLPHGANRAEKIPLCDLDRRQDYGHTCALIVPPVDYARRERFVMRDLEDIMHRLRGWDGCEWDRAQTHASLRRYLIEEAYEACEAIDDGEPEKLCDELGDVLFQVIFHAAIAQEHADFDFGDVVSAVCAKMIRRHEHVFGGKALKTPQAISENWERIKREQRGEQTTAQAIADITKTLPVILRAQKALRKMQDAGFAALPTPADDAEEQLGATLLTAIAQAQHEQVDAQLALEGALRRTIAAFGAWERAQGGGQQDERISGGAQEAR